MKDVDLKMEEYGTPKMFRLLSMYEMLSNNETLIKEQLSQKFAVNEKTFRRDIQDLREYIHEKNETYELEFDKNKGGYCLSEQSHRWLNGKEILAMSKILLESRGFNKSELNSLLDKLIDQALPSEKKGIEKIIGNERLYYVPPKHGKSLLDSIWQMSSYIRNYREVEFTYTRQDGKTLLRKVNPVSIIFSEFYFYLIAFFADDSKDFPAVFRLDRCHEIKETGQVFKIPERLRFQDGLFRNRIQFMYPGELMTIEFKFWGSSIEAVLDRLPTAEISGPVDGKYTIKAEVYGYGIKMWLLSQMEFVEVIRPRKLRDEIIESINILRESYLG
ncbi:MAG: transcriptional regulator [Neobacillus sp.]|jgi:predicted DNA-binding transcriptional regulator YafY|nr:transcriptional regulator [Neobacillus sp.]